MKSIGIMGGTFDPIHFGHVITAEEVKKEYDLDEVVFVPSGNPPHKKEQSVTAAKHRLAMAELAIKGREGLSLSDMEIRRGGYSYALDTVNDFYRIYGEDSDIWFITGADAIVTISHWYKADELMKRCRFIAAARPGYALDENDRSIKTYRDRISLFPETALSISSSNIRTLIAGGASKDDLKEMLPKEVIDYIWEHGLYLEGFPC